MNPLQPCLIQLLSSAFTQPDCAVLIQSLTNNHIWTQSFHSANNWFIQPTHQSEVTGSQWKVGQKQHSVDVFTWFGADLHLCQGVKLSYFLPKGNYKAIQISPLEDSGKGFYHHESNTHRKTLLSHSSSYGLQIHWLEIIQNAIHAGHKNELKWSVRALVIQ